MAWPKVIRANSRSLAEQVPNLCRFHIFLKRKHKKCLLNTKTAYDQRMFIDLEPRSFGQVQGQWKENCKFVSDSYDHNFFFWETLKVLISHEDCLCPEGVSLFDPLSFGQVHVYFYTNQYSLFMSYFEWKIIRSYLSLLGTYKYVLTLCFGNLCKCKVTLRKMIRSMVSNREIFKLMNLMTLIFLVKLHCDS